MVSEQDMFEAIYGRWQGTKKVWLNPDEPALESGTTADMEPIVQDRFVRLRYVWSFKGQAQEGWLIWPRVATPDEVSAVWMDSWHMGASVMNLRGWVKEDGPLRLLGSYSVEPGPNWGWEIVVDHVEADRLQVFMHNITPDGDRTLGVEMRLDRVGE